MANRGVKYLTVGVSEREGRAVIHCYFTIFTTSYKQKLNNCAYL